MPDDLTTALAWLHERLEHHFTIDSGMFMFDGVIVRGHEPSPMGLNLRDRSPNRYELTVYVPAFSVTLDPDELEVDVGDQELRLRTRVGRLDIHDDGGPGG